MYKHHINVIRWQFKHIHFTVYTLILCIFYKLVSEIVMNKKNIIKYREKNKVKENKAKIITKYAKKGAMKHPGIVRNIVF